MLRRLRNAAHSMTTLQRQQERVANNLANANTVGYKRDQVFAEALNERIDIEGAPRSDRRFTQQASFTQGALKATDQPLDVALKGEGFFVIQDKASGEQRYTRAGHFVPDSQGTLRTPLGQSVLSDEGTPLRLPPDGGAIEIAGDGTVRAGDQAVGMLKVVRFENTAQLKHRSGAAFASQQAPTPVETPQVKQGFLEESNVDPVGEMTDMIEHMRFFESQQKTLRTTDAVLGRAVQDLGAF